MADIFLSYDGKDVARAKVLASALSAKGWSVFYDRTIPPGKTWRQVIGKQIDDCQVMVVVWSKHSIDSHWVCEEADVGLQRRILIPIFFDQVKAPLGFRSIQAANFLGWEGGLETPEFLSLCGSIAELISTENCSSDSSVTLVKVSSPVNRANVYQGVQAKSGFEPEMVVIPAGSFQMGGNKYEHEQPIHTVTFAKPFALGKYPVTFAEYDYFAEQTGAAKPSDKGWGRGPRPVINVRWEDASAYVRWLAETTHKRYRLPSEAEWEYAARAGSTGDYFWGDAQATKYAWFSDNSGGKSLPIDDARIKANAFGLYHMAGNVWEWLEDLWHENYNNAPNNGSAWIHQNAGSPYSRVLRGGSWRNRLDYLRSAYRGGGDPVLRLNGVGFRLAQDLP